MAATKLRQVQCQWYQSETTVTASFKLRSLETRGEVTAQFSTNHCAVYDGGKGISAKVSVIDVTLKL